MGKGRALPWHGTCDAGQKKEGRLRRTRPACTIHHPFSCPGRGGNQVGPFAPHRNATRPRVFVCFRRPRGVCVGRGVWDLRTASICDMSNVRACSKGATAGGGVLVVAGRQAGRPEGGIKSRSPGPFVVRLAARMVASLTLTAGRAGDSRMGAGGGERRRRSIVSPTSPVRYERDGSSLGPCGLDMVITHIISLRARTERSSARRHGCSLLLGGSSDTLGDASRRVFDLTCEQQQHLGKRHLQADTGFPPFLGILLCRPGRFWGIVLARRFFCPPHPSFFSLISPSLSSVPLDRLLCLCPVSRVRGAWVCGVGEPERARGDRLQGGGGCCCPCPWTSWGWGRGVLAVVCRGWGPLMSRAGRLYMYLR